MGRRTRPPVEEIPQLKARGLQAVLTTGNGNCLFHALSDQFYGNQTHEVELRTATIEYMKTNPDKFRDFIDVQSGGGTRRHSKRKIQGAPAKFDATGPTPEERHKAFERYLKVKSKGGAYGDNAEILAFALRYQVDIKVFSEAYGYFIHMHGERAAEAKHQPVLYIVHHSYEHYSSIRNIRGPLTGLPQIREQVPSEQARQELQEELAKGPSIQPWMVELACESLPYEVNRSLVEQTLRECRGNINLAVSILFPESSPDMSNRSSSVERDFDSDDEIGQMPTKKQDRRQSRPHPLRNNLALHTKDPDQTSPDPRQLAAVLKDLQKKRKSSGAEETEREDWQNDGPYKDSSASFSASASDSSASEQQTKTGTTRFRLSQPRKPDMEKPVLSSSSSSEKSINGEDETPASRIQSRIIAKPKRRLINGNERAAYLAEKSALNQHLAKHANTSMKQEKTPVLDQGIQAIKI